MINMVNMAQFQGYNAKLSQPGLFGAENIPMKNGRHCQFFAAKLVAFLSCISITYFNVD